MLGERLPRSLGEAWGHQMPATVIALPRWRPRADVTETAGSIVITVELAGVDPDEVEAFLYEDALVVGRDGTGAAECRDGGDLPWAAEVLR